MKTMIKGILKDYKAQNKLDNFKENWSDNCPL